MEENRFAALTDEELSRLVRGGDRDAEEALLLRYKTMVGARARTYFMLGGDSYDITQEGMIGLLSAVRNYDPNGGAAFSSFARTCVDRRILDAIKAANRQKHQILNEAVTLDGDAHDGESQSLADVVPAGSESNPENAILLSETIRLLLENDSKVLSDAEQQVLSLLVADYTKEEIAQKTGKNLKAVHNAIARIRVKIAPFFEQ